eukprot:7316119-Karenia_brevis.AAC.1
MLCAPCVELHSTVVHHNGMTACQLWAAKDRVNMNCKHHHDATNEASNMINVSADIPANANS